MCIKGGVDLLKEKVGLVLLERARQTQAPFSIE